MALGVPVLPWKFLFFYGSGFSFLFIHKNSRSYYLFLLFVLNYLYRGSLSPID